MRKVEVDKDLLYHYYIEENHNIRDTANLMNLKYRTVQRAIKDFNFNKDKDVIQKQRAVKIKEKYGVENVYQLDKSKDKIRQTKLDRYGDENYNNHSKQIETMLDKYGVNCGYNTGVAESTIRTNHNGNIGYAAKDIKVKIIDTMNNRYGVEHPLQNESIKNKAIENMKKTMCNRYGVSHNWSIPEVRNKISKTVQERYGVPYFCMKEECFGKNGYTISKINRTLAKLLEDNGIYSEFEYNINNKSYDMHILDTNILIEINPTYTHNSTNPTWFHNSKKEPLAKDYHFNKTILAKNHNYRCIHIWDWDNINKVIDLIKPKERIYARKCILKEVSNKETTEFLNKYHLQNTCRGQNIRLGLYTSDGDLVQIMTFGRPRYNKNFEYELLRLCTKSGYIVIGGAEKLFNYFINEYKPKSIISYCDNSKFSGNVYTKLGFDIKDFGSPSKHWFNGKIHITDNLLRQRGFDQLFNTNYGKGVSNIELMLSYGFVELYDCGQSIYIYKR